MTLTYRKDIDGLRAFAVLSVIFYHAEFPFFSGGYIGVDIFFVISGFLISKIIIADVDRGAFSFASFYERRVRRIAPALVFTILWCLPLAWFLLSPVDLKDFSQSVVASIFSVSNFLFWYEVDYFDTSSKLKPLIHTWSLSIEEQFYLIFPPLVLFLFRSLKSQFFAIVLCLGFTSLVVSHITTLYFPSLSFYWLHTRAWELLAGSALGYLSLYKPPSMKFGHLYLQAVGLLCLTLPIVLYNDATSHPGFVTIIPVLGVMILLLFGATETPLMYAFSNRVSVAIGLVSYSLYLAHQPIFAFARQISLSDLQTVDYLFLILLSFMIAYFSYKFVERPFRNQALYERKTLFVGISFLILPLVGFGFLGHVTNGLSNRFDASFEPIFVAQKNIEPTVDGVQCHGTFPDSLCVIGAPGIDVPTWALVGDSHAGSFGYSMDLMLKKIGQSGVQLTTGGCSYAISLAKPGIDCLSINNGVRREILSANVKNIVLVGRYVRNLELTGYDNLEGGIEPTSQDQSFFPLKYSTQLERRRLILESYSLSIQELLDAEKNVFLVYPIPEVGWNVPRMKFKKKLRGIDEEISTSYDNYYNRSSAVINLFNDIQDSENLFRIRPDEILCNNTTPGRCITEVDNEILYFDDDHLTKFGAELIVNRIEQELLRSGRK